MLENQRRNSRMQQNNPKEKVNGKDKKRKRNENEMKVK